MEGMPTSSGTSVVKRVVTTTTTKTVGDSDDDALLHGSVHVEETEDGQSS